MERGLFFALRCTRRWYWSDIRLTVFLAGQSQRLSDAAGGPLRLAAVALSLAAFSAGLSACGDEPFTPNAECSNGEERALACGVPMLGEQTQRCVQFQWEDVGECTEDLICAPADTRDEPCGPNLRGVEKQLCGNNIWTAIGECTDTDVCTDDDVFSEPCGPNERGSQNVLCDNGQWALQSCEDSDVCVDDSLEFEDCDDLGNSFRERSCSEGLWGDWSDECTTSICEAGLVELTACGFEDRGVLRTSCAGGQLRTTGECEMRAEHAVLTDTHLFVIADDDKTLFVAGGGNTTLAGRSTEADDQAALREPFGERVQIESEDHLAVSPTHACMIQDGAVYCWGDNAQGQLGVATSLSESREPVLVEGVGSDDNPAVQVVVTPKVSCALLDNGDVRCWGWNGSRGGVGLGSGNSATLPVQPKGILDPIPPVERLFAQEQMVCARALGGAVYCWGDELHSIRFAVAYYVLPGQKSRVFGRGGVIEPTKVQAVNREGERVDDIRLTRENGCAYYSDGAVFCWGVNKNGEVGNGRTKASVNPMLALASGTVRARSLHTDAHRRCVRMSDDSVRCWERQAMGDPNGRLNPLIAESVTSPMVTTRFVAADSTVKSLSVANAAACAVHEDSVLRCTGVSNTGSFGRGELTISQGDVRPVLAPPAD